MEFVDIIVRYVPNYGFLPIVKVEDKEVFRGDFYPTHSDAFDRAKKVAVNFMGPANAK